MHLKLPVSQEILTEVAKFDRFQGLWSAQQSISAERQRRIREAAVVQSVAASCRLAGIHVTNAEVVALFQGGAVPPSEANEILGYAGAMDRDLTAKGQKVVFGDTKEATAT